METTKPVLAKWLASSADATNVSAKVTGVIIGASSFIVLFGAQLFNVTLSATDITSLATGIGMVAGAIWFVYGILRQGAIVVGKA